MIKSKKILLVFFIIFLIPLFYFTFNPYRINNFNCVKEGSNLIKKFDIAIFLPKRYEAKFNGVIYEDKSCSKDDELFCRSDNDGYESINFNFLSKEIEHHWERYDSGEFVFDKTQIIKTKIQDFYQCD